jgi:exosortase
MTTLTTALRRPFSLPVAAAVATVLAVYAPVMAELARDWARDANYSHGFLIPVVSGYLVWASRARLRRIPPAPSWAGLAGLLAGAALLLVGVAGAEVFTQRVSLLVVIASLVLFLAGWEWLRRLAFPIGFLLLAVPLPYILYYGLTGPMQSVAARFATMGLRVVGVPVVAQGNILHLPDVSLEVAEACSGIRSLYAFLAIGALLARSMPVPPWARGAIFLATVPVSVLGNAVRVFMTALGVHLVGPGVARGLAHELFGLIVFGGSLALFLFLRKGVRALWRSEPSSSS